MACSGLMIMVKFTIFLISVMINNFNQPVLSRLFKVAEMMEILGFLVFIFPIVLATEFDPKQHKNWNLLPHDKCGFSSKSRIVGGKEAPLNAYPWIVQLGYGDGKSKNISFKCGGVIATSKVVLTAGHCVYFPSGTYKVRIIRFGEHNTETNPDCEDHYCADPVTDIPPSEIIVPDTFDFKAFQNDIALIRLRYEIKFTYFVKPICFTNSLSPNLVGSLTEVAGWGLTDYKIQKGSTKLLFIHLKVVELKECVSYYGYDIKIGPTQICAGGEVGKDSCSGDSGGPLMKVKPGPRGPRYTLLGIVSFGSTKCGKYGVPAVYTKMFSHMEWFLNNLENTTKGSTKIQ